MTLNNVEHAILSFSNGDIFLACRGVASSSPLYWQLSPVLAMNVDELQQIEDAIELALPEAFRDIMIQFPQILIDDATMSDGDGNEFIDDMMISPDVEAILAGIAHYRTEPGWPKYFLVLGSNGCGEVYSIDVSQEHCPVFVSSPHNDAGASYPHEEGYFEQLSNDLKGWVKGLVQRANFRAAGINPIEQAQRLLDELKTKNDP